MGYSSGPKFTPPPTKPAAPQTSAAVANTAATSVAPFGYSTGAQADAVRVNVNALVTDIAAIRSALQTLGLIQ